MKIVQAVQIAEVSQANYGHRENKKESIQVLSFYLYYRVHFNYIFNLNENSFHIKVNFYLFQTIYRKIYLY